MNNDITVNHLIELAAKAYEQETGHTIEELAREVFWNPDHLLNAKIHDIYGTDQGFGIKVWAGTLAEMIDIIRGFNAAEMAVQSIKRNNYALLKA